MMQTLPSIRHSILLGFGIFVCAPLVSAPAHAQALTPMSPTASAPLPSPHTQPSAPPNPVHRAAVTYTAGQLAISANNSSLTQILHEVARLTEVKITGSIPDERVFGEYGPGDTSFVLEALLHGTNSNLLIRKDAHEFTRELVLTPRRGGVTPPSPSAARVTDADSDDDNPDLPPQLVHPGGRRAADPIPPVTPPNPSVPVLSPGVPTHSPEAALPQPNPQPTPTLPSTATEQSPNGVKTPQQIYDQLLKLQQQPKSPSGQVAPQ